MALTLEQELLTSFAAPEEVARVSLTELTTWLRCKKKYDYAYRQALVPLSPPDYLSKGGYLHALMEQLLLGIRDEQVVKELGVLSAGALASMAAERAAGASTNTVSQPDKLDIDGIFADYLKEVRGQPLPEVLAVEQEFLADLGWERNGEPVGYYGFIDAVLRDEDGSVWIVEHKTASRAWSLGQHQFAYQGRLYAAAWEQLTGERPAGIMYNFFYPKRFATQLTYVTEAESQLLVGELAEVVAVMAEVPSVREPHWGCGDCWFRNLCVTEMQGGDADELRATFKVDEEKRERVNG